MQLKITFFLVFILGLLACEPAIECVDVAEKFTPSAQNKVIDWSKTPTFSLPFKIIYGGPKIYQNQQVPLQHGFSHLVNSSAMDPASLPANQLAMIWYGVAFPDGKQPWETVKSPFGNNKTVYENHWRNNLAGFADIMPISRGQGTPKADIFVFDIERQLKSNDSILTLKQHPSTPAATRALVNNDFVLTYKKELQNLYNEPFNFYKKINKAPNVRFGSYGDSPILNTFTNITGNSWQAWTTNPSLLNPNNYDFDAKKLGGEFYQNQDLLMPSFYFYHDYPSPLAADYLSYMLFQIEVNKAWSSKEIVPFVWLRYSAGFSGNNKQPKFIRPFIAEASAIFPFMAGAKGLWLWEDPSQFNNNESFASYEYFIHGLYRLSKYKEMFDGSPVFVAETNPRDLVDLRKPVWRGVVNGSSILVAASNPYATTDTQETKLKVKYKTWSKTLLLKGNEVYLCKFAL